ncbi:hypothetical protein DPEC_G00111420 [Dallia pectoralis]|uniref:Uncharacterized protein n=1 Tax=Dallia pectoralis TaxID=75939 RepID=A0ACC2GT78_DALPE|nr:hypothetical protein DPEC_G00111420 [Dallia pectoralis]
MKETKNHVIHKRVRQEGRKTNGVKKGWRGGGEDPEGATPGASAHSLCSERIKIKTHTPFGVSSHSETPCVKEPRCVKSTRQRRPLLISSSVVGPVPPESELWESQPEPDVPSHSLANQSGFKCYSKYRRDVPALGRARLFDGSNRTIPKVQTISTCCSQARLE